MTEPATETGTQRFRPHETFFDAQRSNRHSTWRLSTVSVAAAVVMGIPVALIITPALYAIALLAADILDHFAPLPPAFWTSAKNLARVGVTAIQMMNHDRQADPPTLALGAVLMLLPGALLSVGLWAGMNALFRRSGVGGALLALQAREPNPHALEELRLANVVQEMAIAAGLPPPQVMLVDAPGANAAAIGTSPSDARLIVSRRMLDNLSRDELEGALAHLIASIGNGDLRIAFRVIAVFETCGLLVALLNAPFGRESRGTLWRLFRYAIAGAPSGVGAAKEADAVAAVLTRTMLADTDDIDRFFDTTQKKSRLRSIRTFLFFPIVFTNLAIKLSLWFFSGVVLGPSVALLWRTRRYLADACAVQLTRNPDSLAGALEKLSKDAGPIPGSDWASHLFIVAPGRSDGGLRPNLQQQQMLAQAWMASAQAMGSPRRQSSAADFGALMKEAVVTYQAAVAGDPTATARITAVRQAIAAQDPALAAQIPNPADLTAARRGDAAAVARLRASRGGIARSAGDSGAKDGGASASPSSISTLSMVGFYPSPKRRLKRLDRMGAHIALEGEQSKKFSIILAVVVAILAPLVALVMGMMLFLITMMTMLSVMLLTLWMAIIHQVFMLVR